MSKKIRVVKHYSGVYSGVGADSQPVLSKSVCAAMLAGAMVLGGGVFVSSPAYADGYVDGTGNNIYYGYKTDASYTEARFHIEVDYYDTLANAQAGKDDGKDPLGKFVRVHYLSNCNKEGGAADDWRFRPMWWYGVPKGLQNVQNITYTRVEKMTNMRGNQPFVPAGSSQFTFTDTNGYGVASKKTYPTPKQWKSISNFYFYEQNVLASKGWKQLLGLNGGSYDNAGNTEGQWGDYKDQTAGLQGIFVDWESAGQRFYDMTYVGEMTDDAWQKRDVNPLRFAAGVYRFAGNWHYAVGQKHNTPKIADHLKLVYPEVTKVKKPNDLSDIEQKAIKEKIEKANEKTKYFKELVADNGVVVNQDGSATITFKDNTKRTMPASLLVTKDETDKDKYKPVMPERTPVVNLKNLTSDEKTKIRQAIINANGKENPNEFLNHVKQTNHQYEFNVKEDGSVEVTYKDDSKLTIPAEDLVFQGPKIADWAPYAVPAPIEVADPAKLDADEQKKVTEAFDKANADLDVYTAAKKNGQTPVSFDKDFKNAIITWADGSTTEIPSWQFLKQKAAEENPTPKPPTPKPAEEKKMFTVDLPDDPTQVTFDPFDKHATVDQNIITSLQGQLKNRTAKDASDPNKSVAITSATISIADGTVTFKADGYEDKVYPIGIFYKKKVNGTGTQNPTQQTPTSKTDTDPDQAKNTFTYNVRKIETDGDKPTVQDAIKALKQFVKDNYNNVSDDDLATVADSVTVNTKWVPKAGTKNMGAYGAKAPNDGPMTSFSIDPTNGFAITVHGHPWDPDADNGADWNSSLERGLFTIQAKDLYVKKGTQQTPTDNTVEKLKELAKQLRDQRKKAGELTEDAINTLGATDDKINSMNDEKALRDLIKKIADYQKPKPVEYKYNFEKLTLDHEGDLTDDDYKKIVVEQFLKKNYTTTDNTNWSKLEGAYNNKTIVLSGNNANTYNLTPVASGTSGLNIYTGDKQTGSVTSVIVDSKTGDLVVRGWKAGSTSTNAEELIRIKKANLFTPKPKEQNPTPSAEDLKQMKEDAKKIIDRNPKLTDEQKKQFKDKIDQADTNTKEKIQNILKEANEQAGKNNVKSDDIKNKEKEEKEKKEKEKREKDKKDKEDTKLQEDKKKASDAIDGLGNLTKDEKNNLKKEINGDGTGADPQGATTPDAVKKILDKAKAINDAKGALQNDITKGALPFLCHGDSNSDDDKALKDLIGADPSKKDEALTNIDTLLKKTNPAATADELNSAVAAAKRQNAINEQNAKNAGIAKLDAKKADLDAAYNALTEDQKKSAKDKYEAATKAIDGAKTTVNNATKPSDIMTAVNGVDTSLNAAKEDIKKNTPQRDTSGNTNDNADALTKEKEAQKKRINNSNLPESEKKKAIDDINAATKLGDPTGIADRALKAKKIEDALKAIDDFKHLNKAQKDAFKAIINGTDAGNHTNDDGTTSDDIDDALANAANTDNAMARLEELKKKANDFKNEKDGKYSKLTNSDDDKNKKKAFDDYLTDATTLTTSDKGDAKGADEVNTLYDDLLKAMRAIDPDAKSAGLKTDALSKEIDTDKTFKPSETDPTTNPGDSVYNTSSKAKKDEFDKALNEAQTVLNGSKTADISTADKEAAEQKEIDAALDKLVKARLALDGVNTKPLQDEINKDSNVRDLDKYKYATTTEKKTAFDKALQAAQDLIDKLTGTKKAAQGEEDVTTKTQAEKQKLVDDALAKLKAAEEALDGKAPVPVPPSGDENPGSGSESDSGTGSDSDSGSGDSTSTSGGVNKQNLINQINTTENSGGANPGSGAAGANPSTPGAGAQGAGMGAVTPGSGSGAAGTGAAGAASAGVDNKAVNNAVENAPEVKQADAAVKQAAATLDEALAQAKRVAADPHATQAQVDAAAAKLADARKALADAQANAAKVRAAVRSRVIKGMRSRGNAGVATGANVATTGLMATMIAAIGGAFATRRMRTKHANRD